MFVLLKLKGNTYNKSLYLYNTVRTEFHIRSCFILYIYSTVSVSYVVSGQNSFAIVKLQNILDFFYDGGK